MHMLAAAAACTGVIRRSGIPFSGADLLRPGLLADAQPRTLQHSVLQLCASACVLARVPHLSGRLCSGVTGVMLQQ